MPELLASIFEQVRLASLVDIGITALLIYWLFSLIRELGRSASSSASRSCSPSTRPRGSFDLQLLTQILQAGAVVGLFALVVVFQPELRRALERIGRVGSFDWLLSPAEQRAVEHVADEVAHAAAGLSADGHGALIVLERETGLEEVAESGVMIHGDLSADLMRTIFSPRTPLHDGAVIIRGETILAAGALLPLAETTVQSERFGTRHRAALGDHRANRRRGRRRVRGERPDQPRRALADRPEPQRGAARPVACAACSTRPAVAAVARSAAVAAREADSRRPHGLRGDPTPRVIVHNWPLKLAAIGLATLLYGGLVVSQSTTTLDSASIPVDPAKTRRTTARSSLDTIDPVTRSATSRRPGAPGRPRRSRPRSTSATSRPGTGPVSVPVQVDPLDPRDQGPRASRRNGSTVDLDTSSERQVPVRLDADRHPGRPDPGDGRRAGHGHGVRPDVGGRHGRGRAGRRGDPAVRHQTSTRTCRSCPVDAKGQPVAPVELEPDDGPRDDPGLPGRAQQEPAGQPGRDRRRRRPASRSQR